MKPGDLSSLVDSDDAKWHCSANELSTNLAQRPRFGLKVFEQLRSDRREQRNVCHPAEDLAPITKVGSVMRRSQEHDTLHHVQEIFVQVFSLMCNY